MYFIQIGPFLINVVFVIEPMKVLDRNYHQFILIYIFAFKLNGRNLKSLRIKNHSNLINKAFIQPDLNHQLHQYKSSNSLNANFTSSMKQIFQIST